MNNEPLSRNDKPYYAERNQEGKLFPWRVIGPEGLVCGCQGWIPMEKHAPKAGQTVIVWSRQSWESSPSLKIDTWNEQRECPMPSLSSATIPIGYGFDEHDDESVSHWMPLPEAPK